MDNLYSTPPLTSFRSIITITLFITLISPVFSQDHCSAVISDSSYYEQEWIGDNSKLLGILERYGYKLPPDYFDSLDIRGKYRGRRINLDDYKVGNERGRGKIGRDKKNIKVDQKGYTTYAFTSTNHYIEVQVWVHRDAGGNNPGNLTNNAIENYIDERLFEAQRIFRENNVPIVFWRRCNIIYNNTNPQFYVLETDGEEDQLLSSTQFNLDNTFNIHLVDDMGPGGIAELPGNSHILNVGNNVISTLAHEFAHNLGLLHTHNGILPCSTPLDNDLCADCWQEPVSRTRTQPFWCYAYVGQKKCEFAGDGLCDTPAQPNLTNRERIDLNCNYNWNGTDNWDDLYVPHEFNLMSSARDWGNDCVQENAIISPGQIAVMLNNLPNFATTDPGNFSIVGPSNICYYQDWYDYTISSTIPGATEFTWINTEDYPMNGENTQNMSLLPDHDAGFFWVAVIPNCGAPELYRNINVLRSYNNESLPVNGPTSVINYANYTYSTNSYNGVDYSWSIPSGWSVNYG